MPETLGFSAAPGSTEGGLVNILSPGIDISGNESKDRKVGDRASLFFNSSGGEDHARITEEATITASEDRGPVRVWSGKRDPFILQPGESVTITPNHGVEEATQGDRTTEKVGGPPSPSGASKGVAKKVLGGGSILLLLAIGAVALLIGGNNG